MLRHSCRSHVIILILLIPLSRATLVVDTADSQSFSRVFPNNLSYNFTVAAFNTTYEGQVNRLSGYIFLYTVNNQSVIRGVRVATSAPPGDADYPIIFVMKQRRNVLSWEVPAVVAQPYEFYSVDNTLCPDTYCWQGNTTCEILVEVSTSAVNLIGFSLQAILQLNFTISMNTVYSDWVHVSGPKYYLFKFSDIYSSVLLTVTSEDLTCMQVAVTSSECPLRQSISGSEDEAPYQTMTKLAAITIPRPRSGQVYVIFDVQPNNAECTSLETILPSNGQTAKKFDFQLNPLASDTAYVYATLAGLLWCLLFYVGAAIVVIVLYVRKRIRTLTANVQESEFQESASLAAHSERQQHLYGSTGNSSAPTGNDRGDEDNRSANQPEMMTPDVPLTPNADLDLLEDLELHKEVVRAKVNLMVADLSRKEHKYLAKKYQVYSWSTVTASIFYGLPVVQLVLTFQEVMNATGNEDSCYYNFLCARRLGALYNFNNIYSNLGYVLLGLLFMGITHRRRVQFKQLGKERPELVHECGIPPHFGLYYAVGWALVVEGVMSACYHVCPSYIDFQFDASFMYIIGGLLMLRLFQSRHQDINAKSHQAFMALAAIIGLAVIGVVYNTVHFWIVFTILHLVAVLYLSLQVYFMGRFKFDKALLRSMATFVAVDCIRRQCSRPLYPYRLALLIIMNFLNVGVALYGVVTRPTDFPSFVLAIIILNLMGYTLFYIIMKIIHKENICAAATAYLLLATGCWAAALYFFGKHASSWQLTPAESRAQNKSCLLLDFYDEHDVWHFLSASALFLSFLSIFHLDDDLKYVPRNKIPVF